MKIASCLLILCLNFSYFLHSAVARGFRNNSGSAGFVRLLLEDKESQRSVDLMHGYMTNSDLEKAMKEFTWRCSNISRIYSIGESVNGVPLWVVEISDKPGEEEAKPAFKFIGNVHGDEPVGRELLVRLANWICDNHMTDPLVLLFSYCYRGGIHVLNCRLLFLSSCFYS
uniref:Peptidase M14 domain-containing protein n=1 Tax=Rhizophora mucronata TaxID=61149 RepID=A0A2P2M947_RHIMU